MQNLIPFNVYPNITVTKKIIRAEIKVQDVKLFEYVQILAILYDEKDQVVDTKIFTLDKSNGYEQWGFSDQYIIDWVKTQLNNYPN